MLRYERGTVQGVDLLPLANYKDIIGKRAQKRFNMIEK